MEKIALEFIKKQYQSGVESYSNLTKELGLWDSEKYVFQKFLKKKDDILDLGCGTGRTTFPLLELGYTNIIGVDITPEMIERARELNRHFNTQLHFELGDATNLKFGDGDFDVAIFSFNGLMSIPHGENREKAVGHIQRVLKNDGIFIFTTHDREKEEQFFEFWAEEKERWSSGDHNPRLYEYGDLITQSKNESREIFIHIPNKEEVQALLKNNKFEVVETFYRSEKFQEKEAVKLKSGECRFWVARKRA